MFAPVRVFLLVCVASFALGIVDVAQPSVAWSQQTTATPSFSPQSFFTPVPTPTGLKPWKGMFDTSPCDASDAREKFQRAVASWPPYTVPAVTPGYLIETYEGRAIKCSQDADGLKEYNAFTSGYEAVAKQWRGGAPAQSVPPLVIYVHGGLVSGTSALLSATDRMCDFYASVRCDWPSGNTGGDHTPIPKESPLYGRLQGYPLFIAWNSGFGEAERSTIYLPHSRVASVHGWLSRILDRPAGEENFNTEFVSHNNTERPLLNHEEYIARTYDLTLPNIWLWMEREISETFSLPSGDTSLDPNEIEKSDRLGLRLVQQIAQWHKLYPGFRVVIIGHSMGSEYASWLIDTYSRYQAATGGDDAKIFDVIFMAPAVPYSTFGRALRDDLIGHFRMFTMENDCEMADNLIPQNPLTPLGVRYDASLLYFISGVLNPYPDFPILGLYRYTDLTLNGTYADNLMLRDVQNRLKQFADPVALSPIAGTPNAAPLGMRTTSLHHGEFGEDPATMQSIMYLVNDGWSAPARPLPASGRLMEDPSQHNGHGYCWQ